jgi:ABC-type Fe3+/spermidine/putrescine transport system ATPase subunit/ABC-type sulfate transport system permease component
MTRRLRQGPLPWLGALLALYLVVPVFAFFARFAGSHERGFATPGLWGALYVSVVTATISAALIALFGIPLAYALSRSRGRIAAIVGVAVQLPLALPPLMGGILLVEVVGPYTSVGRALGRHLTDSMVGVVIAQCFVAAPFLVVAARAAFSSVDETLTEHAASLGHKELSRFWRVSLPLAGPGIRAGLLLSWLRAFGEYGATVVLAYHPYSLPVYTYVQFSSSGIPTTEAPTALGLLVAVVVATVWRLPVRKLVSRPRAEVPEVPDVPEVPEVPEVAPVPPGARASSPVTVSCNLEMTLGTFQLALTYSAATPRLAVLGPSGSGKSVTLRALAGVFGPRVGAVSYGSRRVDSLAVESRRIGYVPQGYGLFPHLTVWEQVCFGVGAQEGLAAHWIERLHLSGLEQRLPAQLSGGQRQRVALAQALTRAPDLLLLDEPFSALDSPVREELRAEMRALQRENDLSTVLVTHDPEEAAYLADELIVLSGGRVLQSGKREDVFANPASPEVARLIGYRNIHRARVARDGTLEVGTASLGATRNDLPEGAEVVWSVRPEHVAVRAEGRYEAVAIDCVDLGATNAVLFDLGGVRIEARISSREEPVVGSRCRIDIPPELICVWASGTSGVATDDPRSGADPASASAFRPSGDRQL